VRRAASRVLRDAGFAVTEAASADDARRSAVAVDGGIDVLLSDVVLADSNGPDLAHQLLRIRPGLRVVYMSGYPVGALVHRGTELAGCGMVQKPFTPRRLVEAVAGALEASTGNAAPGPLRRGRVLVVDDEAPFRAAAGGLLRDDGFDVVEAGDGQEAVAAIDVAPVDAVISDIHMPNLTGIELLKLVRARDVDVPVILMTGAPGVDSATMAVEYGAFRYMSKPVDGDELTRVVEHAVRFGRLARLRRDALAVAGHDAWRPHDLAGLEVQFESALSALWLEFQPIMTVAERQARAFESLLRTAEPALRSPLTLFAAAQRLGRTVELGREVRTRAAAALAAAPASARLFVNIHAAELEDPALYSPDSPLSRVASRIVLEITEREALEPGPRLQEHIRHLRALGYHLAVDDLGAGYASLSTFSMLAPDVVKLDMSLVRDVHATTAKQKTIAALTSLCHDMGMEVIAEGVEVVAERDCLVSLGCDHLQGFLFARPARAFDAASW